MPSPTATQVAAVRRFNRLYTERIGALDAGHLDSPYTLTEVRVLYELAHREHATASALSRELGIDEGYLSRIVGRFRRLGLVDREPAADARVSLLRLTARGKRSFGPLDRLANEGVRSLLHAMHPITRDAVVAGMTRIRTALAAPRAEDVTLRTHAAGDLGWIVHRHGVLYAREYGYDHRFESIVAGIAADFLANHDPRRERCWIADHDGEVLGSVMLVRKTQTVAKLRLLYLEPHARGLGLGRRLVNECIRFAQASGYRRITLWTQSSLQAARHIYEGAGFRLVATKMHADFGPREAAETWDLDLVASGNDARKRRVTRP